MRRYLPFILVLGGTACPKEAPVQNPPPPQPVALAGANLERGQEVYTARCARCHGPNGKGDGIQAVNFDVPASDLTDPAVMGKLSDADLVGWIRDGGEALGRSPLMPAFGSTLSADDLRDVAAFVKSLPQTGR